MNESLHDTEPGRRGLPRWLKILGLQLVLWPVLLLLVEGGFRLLESSRGRPYDAIETRKGMRQILRRSITFVPTPNADLPINPEGHKKAVRSLHPYLGWEIAGGLQQLDDQLTYKLANQNPNRYDILIVGGSVSQMFGQFGDGRLTEILMQDPRFAGKKIHYLRFGRGGFKQPQQVIMTSYLLSLGFEPEAIINLDGFNEVALGSNNASYGTHPIFPSIPHWGYLAVGRSTDREALDVLVAMRQKQRSLESLAQWSLDKGIFRSAVGGRLVLGRLKQLEASRTALSAEYADNMQSEAGRMVIRGPKEPKPVEPEVNTIGSWAQCSRILQAICNDRGIYYVHALQPTLHDAGSKDLITEDEREGGKDIVQAWLSGVQKGYPLLREKGAELREEGVNFVDLSMVFKDVTETLYFDNCHFNETGNLILADAMGEAYLENLP